LHQRPGGNEPRPSERRDPESGQGLEQSQKRLSHQQPRAASALPAGGKHRGCRRMVLHHQPHN
jgi:hypothetical protein